MPNEPDIYDLIARAKAGDETAIREFLSRFEPEVRMTVRGRLPRMLRTQFDSMDFVQAVWQSFFADLRSTGTYDEEVSLVGVAGLADFARDHAQAFVAAQEPAADSVNAAQRLDTVADVHAHLGRLIHERHRTLAIARVQPLEEVIHRLDRTHGPSLTRWTNAGDSAGREPNGPAFEDLKTGGRRRLRGQPIATRAEGWVSDATRRPTFARF